jgi:glycosyltransferase involved in cell wall biosynthesis
MKNVLLIYGGGTLNGVGQQYINAMLKSYPIENIFHYIVVNYKVSDNKLVSGENIFISKHKNSSLPLYSSLAQRNFQKNSNKDITAIIQIKEREKIDVIWIILNSGQVMHLSHTLLSFLDCKLVTQIWDEPDYLLRESRLDIFTKKKLLVKFDEVLKHSNYIVTISEGMSQKYLAKYNKLVDHIYFAPPLLDLPRFRKRIRQNENLKIAFAGSLYAYKEWRSFLKCIEEINKSRKKPKIEVVFMGTPSKLAYMPSWIKVFPHLPIEQAIDEVEKADIAYLPYWMDKRYEETVRATFPSKLAFYSGAGTPIFYHGPVYSTPISFLKNNAIGLFCDTKNHQEISMVLDKLNSDEFLKNYNDICKEVFQNNFNITIANEKFKKVISLTS